MVLYDLSKTLWVCKATTHVVILGVNALPCLLFEICFYMKVVVVAFFIVEVGLVS